MNIRLICSAVFLGSLSACTFFEEPLDDLGSVPPPPPPPTLDGRATAAAPPPLPTPSQANTQAATQAAPSASADGTYLTVTSIFEVPENAANLSFVHFTKRSSRREIALCEALLNTYQITAANSVPANAKNLIVWPVVEGAVADNCNTMIRSHEPLDISAETARTVQSDATGPFIMSRSTTQDQRMIYDFSSVNTGSLAEELTTWQAALGRGAQNWQPVVKAQ